MKRTFLYMCAAGFLGVIAQPAAAQTCIQDVWAAHGNNQSLTCSANDVTLSQVTDIDITAGGVCQIVDGVRRCSCVPGTPVTFTAVFAMDLTAQTRYDIGFYIASDGDQGTGDGKHGNGGAIAGQCQSTAVFGSGPTPNAINFLNLDSAPDACGDINGPLGSSFNPQRVRFTTTIMCTDPDENGQLELPWCTTWRQPGSNEQCSSSFDAYPGSPSKCNCGNLSVPIFTDPAQLTVTKTVTSGDVPEIGGSATYHVVVHNPVEALQMTLTSLTDDKYGDITQTHAAGGGFLAVTSTTCQLPSATLPPNFECDFTGTVPPGDYPGSFTDIVTACGRDQLNRDPVCASDDATVNYSDQLEDPQLVKTATGTSCVIDANYSVVVTNTSIQDSLTLNTLNDDKFGSIIAKHAAGGGFAEVLDTTCAVPQTIPHAGQGAQNSYTCTFVGRINSCNLSHTDIVTGTMTDDDDADYTRTDSATVNITVQIPQ